MSKISAADLKTHRWMLEKYQRAQELQAEANRLIAGFDVWGQRLREAYDLDKDQGVREDGVIVKVNSEAAA